MKRFVSLYSGAGGLDLGFIAAGFVPIFANDINADAMKTYTAAMNAISNKIGKSLNHKIITGDIRQVTKLPEKNSAELVIGGPPCQGFSVAGKMDPNDPRSRHVFDFLAMVKRVQPQVFVMENVKALAKNKCWAQTIESVREKAEEIGYKTYLQVLNSADYGVPQTRERMFLIGFKNHNIEYTYPQPTVQNWISVADALRKLPPIGEAGNNQTCKARIIAAKKPVLRVSPFAGMLFNGQGRPMNINKPAPTLPASMGGNRTPIVDQEALETGSSQWVEKYHTELQNGGEIIKNVPVRLRRISVQEAAAIQAFPEDMPWYGSQCSRYKQIGNAVPPKMAYAVAKSISSALGLHLEENPSLLDKLF